MTKQITTCEIASCNCEPVGLTKQDETLSEQQRVVLRSYYAEASLARHRAAKHREAGRLLLADVQDTIAINAEVAAIQYRNQIALLRS